MIRILLLIIFIVVIAQMVQWLKRQPPAKRRGLLWRGAIVVAAVALILLAATGRIHWVGAALGALLALGQRLLPLLIQYFPALQRHLRQRRQQGAGDGRQSEVRTATLHMRMDHASERLSGSVVQGPFAGRELDELDGDQLQTLLEFVTQTDPEAEKLLVTYLNHRFGSNWQRQQRSGEGRGGNMSRAEALAILGLNEGADRDTVIQAHRKLMQKVHPDRGGNDYLAAKINRAKDVLIG